jgi:acetylornithine/N-succinyldiaminopimelate aminotransferase
MRTDDVLSKKEKIEMKTDTINIENEYHISFGKKTQLSIERGKGVYVWDEAGKKYLDFTAGWAVTALGYSHLVIVEALIMQSHKIMHNPDSGLTYSPARAKLLLEMQKVLPGSLKKMFFTNSGAEANDAAIKLSRKITNRKKVLSAQMSFHGRTLATASATGQNVQRDRFNVLVPFHEFFKYNDIDDFIKCLDSDTAAVVIEPIQGEGGIVPAEKKFLQEVDKRCKENGTLLIVDEIQTGFFRTGPAFLSEELGIQADFLTMAKGIAGGFPFGAVAVTDEIAMKIEYGDHGGTYIGNPLGCAVAAAVVSYMVTSGIEEKVRNIGEYCKQKLMQLKEAYPELIKEIRGRGLLWAVEFTKQEYAAKVLERGLELGLIVNLKHGTIIRIFPALVISEEEIGEGLSVMEKIFLEIKKL